MKLPEEVRTNRKVILDFVSQLEAMMKNTESKKIFETASQVTAQVAVTGGAVKRERVVELIISIEGSCVMVRQHLDQLRSHLIAHNKILHESSEQK